MPDTLDFDAYSAHAAANQFEILRSHSCGCYFCRSLFDARLVQDYDDGATPSALCPHCGMPAVLGDASGLPFDKGILKALNLHFFGADYMEKHLDAARTYCQRYIANSISHKKTNFELFTRYLTLLAKHDDPRAIFTLGTLHEYGTEFTAPDIAKAYSYYSNRALYADPAALIALGRLEIEYGKGSGAALQAYEHFSKATALGSYAGIYELANCYFEGIAVAKDPYFGVALLHSAYDDVYANFVSSKRDAYDFVDYSYRLGVCSYKGEGVEKDRFLALRYFLLARFGCETLRQSAEADHSNAVSPLYEEILDYVKKLAKEFQYEPGDPVLDQDTFYDTFSDNQDTVMPKGFSLVSYLPESGELRFAIHFLSAPLVIDCANLYCGFGSNTMEFRFTDVADFRKFSGDTFQRVVSPDQDSWRFESDNPTTGESEVVASLRFYSDPAAVASLAEQYDEGKQNGK